MPYGTIKVDNIIFTNGGSDQTVTVSGIVASTSGNLTVTGTISGGTVVAPYGSFTSLTGVTTSGTNANFQTITGAVGVYTTSVSGRAVNALTANIVSGVFASGTAAAPSITFTGNTTAGIYSPGANQVAVATNGTQRLTVDTAATTSTLPVVHPLGAVGTPSLTFTGDLNTGIYSPGADQLAISTGGIGKLFIDSLGNIGVGTASPSAWSYGGNITILGSGRYIASTSDDIRFAANVYSSDVDRYVANGFATRYRMSDGTHQWSTAVTGIANNAITYNESMRITAGGLVGIGTSSPSSLLHLVSSGQPAITVADNGGRSLQIKAPDSSANPGFVGTTTNHDLLIQAGTSAGGLNIMRFNTAGAERIRITDTGNVGIGTTSPGASLHVKSTNPQVIVDSPDASTESRIRWYKNGSSVGAIYSDSGNLRIISESALAFTINGGSPSAESARIDSSGRLLVGTSSGNANGGILQLSSGITFPATAVAASDANTLDDYEEGTWTPALKFGGNSVSMTGSYAGKYVKVGKIVYYSLSIALTAKGSSTGNTTITGLPFTNASGGNENYSTTIAFMYNGVGLTGPLMPRVDFGSTTLDVFQNGATGYATVSQTNFNNDSQIQAFGFYFI